MKNYDNVYEYERVSMRVRRGKKKKKNKRNKDEAGIKYRCGKLGLSRIFDQALKFRSERICSGASEPAD